jgi:tRNA A37 threonylcarbamoyladenosine modification protein TsaB
VAAHGHILAIEISNPSAGHSGTGGPGVALGRLKDRGVDVLDVEPVRASGFGARPAPGSGAPAFGGHDDDLMPAIDRLFGRTGVRPRAQLALVAVSVGPGGYTSLRVACAVGKMIAAAAANAGEPARCVGVPTAMAVLESAPADVRAGHVAVALASKAETAWIECFDAGLSTGPGRIMTAENATPLIAKGARTLIADRFLPQSIRSALAAAGARVLEPVFDAAACARVGVGLPSIAPSDLVPIYPREPDAVTLWRSRAERP